MIERFLQLFLFLEQLSIIFIFVLLELMFINWLGNIIERRPSKRNSKKENKKYPYKRRRVENVKTAKTKTGN